LKYDKAKKAFIQDVEDLRIKSTFQVFSVDNCTNSKRDCGNKLCQCRYNYIKSELEDFRLEPVTQDELLKLELRLLNTEQALSMSQLEEKRAQASLNSFLGMEKSVEIECIVPSEIPKLQINPDVAITQAHSKQS
jgi:hypothetical protein